MIANSSTDFNQKPTAPQVIIDNIPEELRRLRRWLLWRYELPPDAKKWTKVPYNPRVFYDPAEHKKADKTKPNTWGTFEQCYQIYRDNPSEVDGIGFVLVAEDGYLAIDGDRTKDTPNEEAILRIKTYAERSPSGVGLRLIGKAKLPENKGKKRDWLELYSHNAYVTITGQTFPGRDHGVRDIQPEVDAILKKFFPEAEKKAAPKGHGPALEMGDEEILALCRAAKNAAKFEALYGYDEAKLRAMGARWAAAGGALVPHCLHR